MSSRTRSRRPVSIESNQSSRRWPAVSACDCRACDFILLLVMAWSPPALKRRLCLGFNHPETKPPSIPTTPRTAPGQLDQMDLPSINRRIQREHERVGFPLIFAGINISVYEDAPPKTKPRWQMQLDGIVAGLDVDAIEAGIPKYY